MLPSHAHKIHWMEYTSPSFGGNRDCYQANISVDESPTMANTSSMDDSPARSDIIKFNGTNYRLWSCQVRAKLMEIGAWRIATGDLKAPGKNASEKERQTFNDLSKRGYSIIYLLLEEQYQTDIDDVDTCHGAWNRIKFYHENTEEHPMVPDLLADLPDPYETEGLVEKWRIGRLETIEVLVGFLKELRVLSKSVRIGQTGAASSRIFGNALSLAGAVLELYKPEVTNVTQPMKAWGDGFDKFGKIASPLVTLVEIGISWYMINQVEDALKVDEKKSGELKGKLLKMADSDQRMKNDHGFSLIEVFQLRGGKMKNMEPNSENQTEIKNKKDIWRLFYYLLRSFSVDRYVGDEVLYRCGVSEPYRKFSLDAVVLVLDAYDLMKSVGIEEAQYVTYVENWIKILKIELEMSFPKQE